MKRGSTILLRLALVVIASIALVVCIFALPAMWRAVPAEFPSYTYVFYYILSATYVAAAMFFAVLYQAWLLLGYIDANRSFSKLSVHALRRIGLFALMGSAILASCLPFFYVWADFEDAPGLILFNAFLAFVPFVIAVFAWLLQRLFQEALAIKSENDLTV